MVDSGTLAILGLNVISATVILALAALGLGIVFGLMGVINTAHGAFLTLGAYTAWFVSSGLGVGFWIGVLLAPVVGAFFGLLTERFVVRFVYGRLLDSILATWGVALILGELIKFFFGTTTKGLTNPLPGNVDLLVVTYPLYRIFIIIFGTLILVGAILVIYYTNFGVRLRAAIQDSESAKLLGINQERIYQISFAFGTALAALAGALIAPLTVLEPQMGLMYLLQSFFAIMLGGSGTLLGILPGSLIVGGGSNIMTFYMRPTVALTLIYVIVIAIIMIWPRGILTR